MRTGGTPALLVGRRHELTTIRRAVRDGVPVVVTGPAGIGKTALVHALTGRTPTTRVVGLAALTWRPWRALAVAAGRVVPTADVTAAAAWFVDDVAGLDHTFVVDDAQFCDLSTLETTMLVARRLPTIWLVRTGEPTSASTMERLGHIRDLTVVDLGPLPRAEAVELCGLLGAPDPASAAEMAGGNPLWCRLHAQGDIGSSIERSVAARLARCETDARTAIAALGLLGRPAHRSVLGHGVAGAVAAELATVDDNDVVRCAQDLFGQVAVARLTGDTRVALHRALAERVVDPAEAARHFHAAGDVGAALAAARGAPTATGDANQRATVAALVAELSGDSVDWLAAATAHAIIGDLAHARLAASRAADGGLAEGFVAAAAACRRAGDLSAAVDWLDRLRRHATTWPVEGSVEAFLIGRHDLADVDADTLTSLAASTPSESAAWLAAAVATFDAKGDWRPQLDVAAQLCGSPVWRRDIDSFAVSAYTAAGETATAFERALVAADAARKDGAVTWAARFDAEAAWLRILIWGPAALTDTDAAYSTLAAFAAVDAGHVMPGSRLVADDLSPRGRAVAACAAWWDGDASAGEHARDAVAAAGVDPVVRLLAWPVLAWCRHGDVVESGMAAVDAERVALQTPPTTQSDEFLAAAAAWSSVAARGEIRTRWAAGRSAIATGDLATAASVARDVDRLAAETGVQAIDGRLNRLLLDAGLPPRRRPREHQLLSSRELEVLQLVGAGLSTPQIARRLGVAASTVDTHVRAAVVKLGAVNRRTAAAMVAT